MKIELGYACLNTSVTIKMKTLRLKTYLEKGNEYLKELVLHNLNYLMECLKWNKENQVFFFRVSSDLVPLATHHEMSFVWQEDPDILAKCREIKAFAKLNGMRLSMHPGQYTLLNSHREEVLLRSVEDLEYHRQMAELLGVTDLILHVGGVYGDKSQAVRRWVEAWETLSQGVKDRLRLENDEKSYTIREVLEISDKTGIPAVLDFHHHRILPSMDTREALIKAVESWSGIGIPKVHLSSGKVSELDPKHHDLIHRTDYEMACEYFQWLPKEHKKIYLMLEAKKKEQSILKLRDQGDRPRGLTDPAV